MRFCGPLAKGLDGIRLTHENWQCESLSDCGAGVDGRSVRLLPSRCEWRRISERQGHVIYTGRAMRAHAMRKASRTTKSNSAFCGSRREEINCVSGTNGLARGRARHINTEALNQNCAVHHQRIKCPPETIIIAGPSRKGLDQLIPAVESQYMLAKKRGLVNPSMQLVHACEYDRGTSVNDQTTSTSSDQTMHTARSLVVPF